MSTGPLWPWIEAPCRRCQERALDTGNSPVLEVPVFFPTGGPEEHWSDLHRALCLPCYRAEREQFGRATQCLDCQLAKSCESGQPPFKGTCAAIATLA